MCYASRFYAKPERFPTEWAGVVVTGRAPSNRRVGLILDIENRQWQVTLGGYANSAPPTDEAGFLRWHFHRLARRLRGYRRHRVRVTRMTAHPRVLFTPTVLAHVARVAISGRTGMPTRRFALSSPALATLRRLPSADTGHQLPAN